MEGEQPHPVVMATNQVQTAIRRRQAKPALQPTLTKEQDLLRVEGRAHTSSLMRTRPSPLMKNCPQAEKFLLQLVEWLEVLWVPVPSQRPSSILIRSNRESPNCLGLAQLTRTMGLVPE